MTPQTSNLMRMCTAWGLKALGVETIMSPAERGLRLVEEAVELAQALGVPKTKIKLQVDKTYSRETGEPAQEVAGTLFTLYVLCEVLKIDPEVELRKEITRVDTPEMIEKCRAKQHSKIHMVDPA